MLLVSVVCEHHTVFVWFEVEEQVDSLSMHHVLRDSFLSSQRLDSVYIC